MFILAEPVWANPDVRKAINKAIRDRAGFVRIVATPYQHRVRLDTVSQLIFIINIVNCRGG
jgi:hypothetical protein